MIKRRRNSFLNYKILSIFLLILVLVLTAYILYPQPFNQSMATIILPDLSTTGFTEVALTVDVDTGTIKLGGNCYQLTATVENAQALSIQNGIDRVVGPRPNAHDLFNDMIKALNIKILMIKITELKDNAYHSSLIARQGNTILKLDARPSDAIAIATRTDYLIPIYINETLLKTVGEKIC
jgi:bifunctional DNase/RNase